MSNPDPEKSFRIKPELEKSVDHKSRHSRKLDPEIFETATANIQNKENKGNLDLAQSDCFIRQPSLVTCLRLTAKWKSYKRCVACSQVKRSERKDMSLQTK